MTKAQRVGQLFIFGLRDDRLGPAEVDGIREHHLGSVTFIETTTEGVSGVRRVADAVQAEATKANTAGARFFVAANQEGGDIQALRGQGFDRMPSAVDQGALSPATLQSDAERWGTQLIAAGVNLNFGPVMDVVPVDLESTNQPIGALHREYGNDPTTVSRHGVAFLRGMRAAGVTTTAKHFPGLGRVTGNTDFVSGVVDSTTTADDPDLAPFHAAVRAGVPMAMVALARYTQIDPAHLAVFSPVVVSILQQTEGFQGVIVSDDIGAAEAVADIPPGTRAISFLQAGGDLIISKFVEPADQMATAILRRIRSSSSFRPLAEEAVRRVLDAKDAAGLLPCSG
jgi:beta-N-acetylhexosaminidase